MKTTVHIVDEEFVEIDTRKVDERKRLTLGAALGDLDRVRILKNSRGEILLQPLADIPASDVWLYTNREASELVQKGIKEAGKGKVSRMNPDEL
jgi:3'-phosphoadenosine 5'-phosphosulfate sulfotransferase (PAPS reductase)/FAD synthetase